MTETILSDWANVSVGETLGSDTRQLCQTVRMGRNKIFAEALELL